jgi:hypothetical protein
MPSHLKLTLLVSLCAFALPAIATDCVILLHGLARTTTSMEKAAEAFAEQGYAVVNIGYPSRDHRIEDLAPLAIERGLDACPDEGKINFYTHSLGGILVRFYLEHNEIDRLGRVVMVAPPNRGSQVVDSFKGMPGFGVLNGPAGAQLGTGANSVPLSLGPVDYPVGVVAGTQTFNPILSQFLPNPDDGKVSVESTKIDGMTDFIALPHSHPFIMKAPDTINQAIAFIETGSFLHGEEAGAESQQPDQRLRP